MSNAWLKIKVWTKIGIVVLVLVYATFFVVNNSEKEATVWLLWNKWPEVKTTSLKLVVITFLLGAMVAVLTRTALRTVRQIRELKTRQKAEKIEKDIADMKAKAAMLRARPESATPESPDAEEAKLK